MHDVSFYIAVISTKKLNLKAESNVLLSLTPYQNTISLYYTLRICSFDFNMEFNGEHIQSIIYG